MQCLPLYPKKENILSKLFGTKKSQEKAISTYTVEAGTGEKIYTKDVHSLQEVVAIFRAYYTERKLPNLSHWVDSGIL